MYYPILRYRFEWRVAGRMKGKLSYDMSLNACLLRLAYHQQLVAAFPLAKVWRLQGVQS
jgi:hypothetical protein